MAALFLYGGWEYSRLCGFSRPLARFAFTACQALLLAAGLLLLYRTGTEGFGASVQNYFSAIAVTSIWGFTGFASAPGKWQSKSASIIGPIQGLIMISGAWLALSWLRFQPLGSWWILQLLIIIWAADVAAYFTGRAFGKRKLAPHISPGKTWAGVGGAVVIAPLAALICARVTPLPDIGFFTTILLALLTVFASIGGDLFISLKKRAAGVKDSGKLLPGHGGVLDRFDSLITGSVFFVLVLMY